MAYGITSAGFNRPRLADIKTDIEQLVITTFGATVNLNPESVFGQLIGLFADRESSVWDAMEDVYNSQYPDTAFGLSLDNVGALSGITRKGALASTVAGVRLFGTVGTLVPAGTQFQVSGSPTSIFATDNDVTLIAGQDTIQKITFGAVPDAGSFKINFYGQLTTALPYNTTASAVQAALQALPYASGALVSGNFTSGFTIDFAGVSGLQFWPAVTISANSLTLVSVPVTTAVTILQAGQNQAAVNVTATATGPVVANASTLTVILTPVSGLNSVNSVVDAVLGRDTETDNEYRARRATTLQVAGAGTPEAIRSRVLEVADVTAAIVFENETDITDIDGRPPHSVEVVIQGGDDQTLWDLLWQIKPAGIKTLGTEVGTVTDSNGQVHTLRFSRPTDVPIYVDLTLTINVNFPATGVQAAKDAIVASGNALGIGKEVVTIPYLISSISSIPGIEDAVLLIGTSPSPTLSDNIPIAVNEIALFDSTRVNVTTI